MKKQAIAHTPYTVSRIVFGCMGLGGDWNAPTVTEQSRKDAVAAVRAALDAGIDYIDHADIYGKGKSEEAFSAVWAERPGLRQSIVLQTKCGIIFPDAAAGTPGRYDFSSQHIRRSLEGSLHRLKTDFIDILLLHRPDALVEPEEVADAFDRLHFAGKVRYFGVSNHSAAQIELLRTCVTQPLVVNQLELNLVHNQLFNAGITTDQRVDLRTLQMEGTLEYCPAQRHHRPGVEPSRARGVREGPRARRRSLPGPARPRRAGGPPHPRGGAGRAGTGPHEGRGHRRNPPGVDPPAPGEDPAGHRDNEARAHPRGLRCG